MYETDVATPFFSPDRKFMMDLNEYGITIVDNGQAGVDIVTISDIMCAMEKVNNFRDRYFPLRKTTFCLGQNRDT